jgi:hypothetical protein
MASLSLPSVLESAGHTTKHEENEIELNQSKESEKKGTHVRM